MNTAESRLRRQQRLDNNQPAPQPEAKSPQPPADALRAPSALPDPFLFNSETLLRELDRCREMVLLIPCNGDMHATRFGINNAIVAIWNLREQLRYLLSLHREAQRAFVLRGQELTAGNHPQPASNSRRGNQPRKHTQAE